jgi:hypothetical protein
MAVGLVAASGCVSFHGKAIPLPAECTAACGDVPCPCRGKVYVFLLSGFDPLDLDRVADVKAALVGAGFAKVYDGQFYDESFFRGEIRRLAKDEPDARFVLVGFSLGAEIATGLAQAVGKQGISVAMVATVDPYWWSSAPRQWADNVGQVVHVHGQHSLFSPTLSTGSNVEIPGGWLTNVTANPRTVETVARALVDVAETMPRPSTPPADMAFETPTPRPVARGNSPRDDWDFLKPVATLPVPRGFGDERTTLRPLQAAFAN